MVDKKYCICCGEEVPYYTVERDQKREYACSFCGFTLEVFKLWEEEQNKVDSHRIKPEIRSEVIEEKKIETEQNLTPEGEEEGVIIESKVSEELKIVPEEPPVKYNEEKTIDASSEREMIKLIEENVKDKKTESGENNGVLEQSGATYSIVAEDSEFLRTLLRELILRKAISNNVITVSNGLELIAEYTRLMNERVDINFAIVDINMPEMDGLTAVRTIRAMEDRNNRERVPVVFFSAVKADENLRKQMNVLAPANYINKGVSSSPQALAERIEVLLHFLTYRYAKRGKKASKVKSA